VYRKESDLLGEFLDEKTVAVPHERVDQGQLYFDWKHWCENNGVSPGAKKTFTQRLAERGFSSAKSDRKHFYTGLKRRGGLT
jgi:putative DNA primase/helicase